MTMQSLKLYVIERKTVSDDAVISDKKQKNNSN